MRLWSLETVFSKVPSEQGRMDTLQRLKQHRDDVSEVIAELNEEIELEWEREAENELIMETELEQEMENESWLKF